MQNRKNDQINKVKAIKRPKKLKPIEKQQKKKEQKQTKNAGRGRPVKNMNKIQSQGIPSQQKSFSIDSEYNSIDLIKNNFIQYLTNIGYTKGLVFTEQVRKKLKAEQQNGKIDHKIQWDSSHKWNREQQLYKIQQSVYKIKKQGLIKEQSIKDLSEVFLDIGDIFAREVTREIYRILQNLILLTPKIQSIHKGKEIQQVLKDYIEHVCTSQEYYFVTGKFSKIYLPNTNKSINIPLTILFRETSKKFRQILKNGKVNRE